MTGDSLPGQAPSFTAVRIQLRGEVQGLGVRPAVANLASRCGVHGFVANIGGGVEIVVEGSSGDVADFRQQLASALPREATVQSSESLLLPTAGFTKFSILEGGRAHCPAAPIPRDRGVCGDCLSEALSMEGRRSGYAFTSCTKCGPRFSILTGMPYERSATSMRGFRLCPPCLKEFCDPDDRRFHAQTNACAQCGPRFWSTDPSGMRIESPPDPVRSAIEILQEGGIVALCGLGGYQLLCDATSESAVRRLRAGKRRPEKPFAILVPDLPSVVANSGISDPERSLLSDAANPIVIVGPHDFSLAPAVCCGVRSVGILLPTTPLHALLVRECDRPLVVTSGNEDGDPLAASPDDAQRQLSSIADLLLHHDRPIVHAIDDSVARIMAGRQVTLRAARGLAPVPLDISRPFSGVAVGGHQKVAIAWANGAQAALGPHLGDLDSIAMRTRFESHLGEMLQLYGVHPAVLVGDQHPDYITSRWLESFGDSEITVTENGPVERRRPRRDSQRPQNRPQLENVQHIIRVQHHHAHIAAGMIEAGWLDRDVLGIAFDGTGFGPDGTIWGGEILRCTLNSFRRVGRIRPFPLPGGEAAIREPWRIALSLLHASLPSAELDAAVHGFLPASRNGRTTNSSAGSRLLSPLTSSVGRLFDGVAALILSRSESTFEGQLALALEEVCDDSESGAYPMPIAGTELREIDWRPMVTRLLADLRNGVAPAKMASRFHRGLSAAVVEICHGFPNLPVVLGGGVFQNRVLVEQIAGRLPARRLALPGMIPPNDGGLAAGQLAIAAHVMSQRPHLYG